MQWAGDKGVSQVIAALVITGVLLAVFSGLYSMQLRLHQAEVDALKREADRAMEAPFQIFWLNSTHVRLFNNYSSVDVNLRYWVEVDSGGVKVLGTLNPSVWSVPPGTFKDVNVLASLGKTKTSGYTYKVVSERGMVFVVGESAPSAFPQFTLTNEFRVVRPGFTGLLTRLVLATGPGFTGGNVVLTCVPGTPDYCSLWSISFVPSSPVNVPSGGSVTVNVMANIPTSQSLGSYYIRLRADAGGQVAEFVVNVVVGDFSILPIGITITLNRAGCLRTLPVNVGTLGGYVGEISFRVSGVPAQLSVWISPNPLNLEHGYFSSVIYILRDFSSPTGTAFTTSTLTLAADDGLGPTKTATFVVVHRGQQSGTC